MQDQQCWNHLDGLTSMVDLVVEVAIGDNGRQLNISNHILYIVMKKKCNDLSFEEIFEINYMYLYFPRQSKVKYVYKNMEARQKCHYHI